MVIVSMPSRSQRSLARASEPGWALPSMEPKAKIVSYSGIFALSPASSPSRISYCLPHATGHFRHVVSLVVVVRVHLLAGDRHGVREHLLAQVVGAERAERVDRLHEERACP